MNPITSPEAPPVRQTGGWYLAEAPARGEGRYPEDLDAELREFQQTVRQFVENEVVPQIGELDSQPGGELMPKLLRELADLGFFQAELPEFDGGLGLGLVAMVPMMEEMGRAGSLHVAAMVHQGIGTQPIAYYGNDEQRGAYLPAAMECSKFGAYALTEPSSGSDALSMKTTAVRAEDGSGWILNGNKQFITNAGFADYFVVFARVDGDKITAFIVDRGAEGFEVQAEEHKMGIKGSSTCPLRLQNVKVSDSRRLGDVGVGHKIALNLLNLGRLKLGVTVIGANKYILREAVKYAIERKQFDTRVADFGMTRLKIAECAALTFAGESMAYRTAGFIQDMAEAADADAPEPAYASKIAAADAFSPECAMVKAWLTESGCVVADHALQMLGGYGFIEEYPTARAYRDARIARLYEGTNEINRLHCVNTLMRRVSKGEMGEGWLESLAANEPVYSSRVGLGGLRVHVASMKTIFGMTLNGVVTKLGDARKLKGEQEIASHLADMMMELFAAESSALRAERIGLLGADHPGAGDASRALAENFARAAVGRCSRRFRDFASRVASAMAWEGWTVQFLSQIAAVDAALGSTLEAERAIAQAIVDNEGEWPEFASAAE